MRFVVILLLFPALGVGQVPSNVHPEYATPASVGDSHLLARRAGDERQERFETEQNGVAIPAARPTEDFYGAAGRGVTAQFRVEKAEVDASEWFPLTLLVDNVVNPEAITPPDLRQIGEFRERFDFGEKAGKKQINDRRCEIVYTVRVKDAAVTEVPAFRFRYYLVGSETGKIDFDFPTTLSKSVPLTVRRAVPPSWVLPIEPEAVVADPKDYDFLLRNEEPRARRSLGVLWLLPPGLAVAWVLVWRWRYPDAAKLARLWRSRAARRALDRLTRPGEDESVVLLEYLRQRFGLESWRTTPDEIAEVFEESLGFYIKESLRLSEHRKYGIAPTVREGVHLTERFRQLILELEESAR